jgi:hypothetical protein
MILVLAVATMCAALASSYRNGFLGTTPDMVCLNLAFIIGALAVPWLMLLLFLFDRRGPVRNWFIGYLMALWPTSDAWRAGSTTPRATTRDRTNRLPSLASVATRLRSLSGPATSAPANRSWSYTS